MGDYAPQQVVFPFEEALPAAAALWQMAITIGNTEQTRQSVATTALVGWQGKYAENFVTTMQNSATSANNCVTALQQAAGDLASAWANAHFQQQTYNYYAMVQYKKDHESHNVFSSFGHWLMGDHTNFGKPPAAPGVPSAPNFYETQVPQAAVPGVSLSELP